MLTQDFSLFSSVSKETFRGCYVNLGRDRVLRHIFSLLLATIRGMKLTTHIYLVSRLRVSGSIHPPHFPLRLQGMDRENFTATELRSLGTLCMSFAES